MIHNTPGMGAMLGYLRTQPNGRKLARSLAASRYIDFPNDGQDKEWRRRNSLAIQHGATHPQAKLPTWRSFALDLAGPEEEKSPRLLFARQESRLMVNMAGGVFENGGLSLDRLSGVPFIPGSTVKGCARRTALAALQEWTSGQLQANDSENLLAPVIDGFVDPSEFLLTICLVFGWSDLEWKAREDFHEDADWQRKRSDFAWALGDSWESIRLNIASGLCSHLSITPDDMKRPWASLPHFAGTISFLPAYPWDKDPGIDLDIVTCHHGEYYRDNPAYSDAPDTEEPVPVVFPAIAPGQTWAFLLHPTVRASGPHLTAARKWLAIGLEAFGIGAKTNAGYGWFDASDTITTEIVERIASATKRVEEEVIRKAEEEKKKADEEERLRARQAEADVTANMTDDEKADWRIAQLNLDQFNQKIRNFFKEPKKGGPSDEEKKAIVRALRNPRLTEWIEFKAKAAKGGDPAKSEQAIRTLNKQLHGDKMP